MASIPAWLEQRRAGKPELAVHRFIVSKETIRHHSGSRYQPRYWLKWKCTKCNQTGHAPTRKVLAEKQADHLKACN